MYLSQIALILSFISLLAAVTVLVVFNHKAKPKVTQRAAADLLDYATLASEEVIVLKNGGLMKIYELILDDLGSADESRLLQVRTMVKRAVLKLGGNYAVHVDALRSIVRDYLPKASDPGSLTASFDNQKAALLKEEPVFKTRFYLTLTKLGEKTAVRALTRIMTEKEGSYSFESGIKESAALIENFEGECRTIADTLSLVMKLRPLGFITGENGERCHEGLSYLYRCYSGISQKIVCPEYPVYLDAVIAAQDLEVSFTPKIGRMYCAVIAIEGIPAKLNFLVLNALASLSCEYRFTTRYLTFDDFKSAFLLERYRRFWLQRQRGLIAQLFNLNGRLNLNAVEKVQEVDAERARLDARDTMFGSYCATVCISDENFANLEKISCSIVRRIEDLGFACRLETVNAIEAFLGSLPGHVEENVRRPMVNHEVLTDLLPLSQAWIGESICPHPMIGRNNTPLIQCHSGSGRGLFYLNLHDRDLGNTIVIGPPGAGKSVLLGEIMLNFLRYQDAKVFAFDKGWSFYALTRALEGEHLRFDNNKASFCPLEYIDTTEDLEFALEYIETMARLCSVELNASLRLELTEALKLLSLRPGQKRSLSDLHMLLSSRHLKEAIEGYTVKSNSGSLLDGFKNPDFKNPLTVFECSSLFESSKRFMIPVLKHLFRLLEKSFDGKPKAIIVDEAWLMLEEPYFASELIKWFKTLRKHNVFVVLATQSLTDLSRTTYFEAFLDCAKTRIFLPNFDAGGEILAPIYEKLGLNLKQIEIISRLEPKKEYFLKKGPHSSLFELNMLPQELKLLSFAGDHIVDKIDSLYAEHGPDLGLHLRREKLCPDSSLMSEHQENPGGPNPDAQDLLSENSFASSGAFKLPKTESGSITADKRCSFNNPAALNKDDTLLNCDEPKSSIKDRSIKEDGASSNLKAAATSLDKISPTARKTCSLPLDTSLQQDGRDGFYNSPKTQQGSSFEGSCPDTKKREAA